MSPTLLTMTGLPICNVSELMGSRFSGLLEDTARGSGTQPGTGPGLTREAAAGIGRQANLGGWTGQIGQRAAAAPPAGTSGEGVSIRPGSHIPRTW
jgi:hypothetical protein